MVRPAQMSDLPGLRPILEQWMRDRTTGELETTEVMETLDAIDASIHGLNDRTYVVAEDSDGEPVGVMGMVSPAAKMLEYAETDHPIEFINAFVDRERRGTGAGKKLEAELTAVAAARGYTEVVVNSGPRYKDSGWAFWQRLYGEPVAIARH